MKVFPSSQEASQENQIKTNKIFLGGLLQEVDEGEIEHVFKDYGNITLVEVLRDSTGKKRGFGFVTFEDHDAVDKIVLEKYHEIGGKLTQVTKAIPKEDMARFGKESRYSDRGRYPPRGNASRPYRPMPAYNDSYENDYNNYPSNNYNARKMPQDDMVGSFGFDDSNNDIPFNNLIGNMMADYPPPDSSYHRSYDSGYYNSRFSGNMRMGNNYPEESRSSFNARGGRFDSRNSPYRRR